MEAEQTVSEGEVTAKSGTWTLIFAVATAVMGVWNWIADFITSY